jgi:hypothetical protein
MGLFASREDACRRFATNNNPHYGAGRVDAVADGLFVRTGFWTGPDLASEITRAAAVTTVDTIRGHDTDWAEKVAERRQAIAPDASPGTTKTIEARKSRSDGRQVI